MRNTTLVIAVGAVLLGASLAVAAGNVTVQMRGKNLVIRGDGDGNHIVILNGPTEGELEVSLLGGTTLNGGSDPLIVATPKGRFDVELGGGDDILSFVSANDPLLLGDVDADLGVGDDEIVFFSYSRVMVDNVRIRTSDGDDQVTLYATSVDGKLSVVTGAGQDRVSIRGSTELGKTASFDTGDDRDEISLTDSKCHGKVKIDLGGGSDDLTINGVVIDKPLAIRGEGGLNFFDFDDSTFAKKVKIKQNEGNLRIHSDGNGYEKGLAVKSGDDDDTFYFTGDRFGGSVMVQTREGWDDVRFTDGCDLMKTLVIKTTDGEDRIEMRTSTFAAKVKLLTGDGDDSFEVTGNTFAKKLLMNAGDGDDEQVFDAALENTFNGPAPKIVSIERLEFP